MEISVWFGVKQDQKFQKLISEIAANTGRPDFTPHITVLESQKDMIPENVVTGVKNAVKELRLKPVKVSFSRLVLDSKFYRCVYLLVDPEEKLRELHKSLVFHTCTSNGITYSASAPLYRPHISLIYGDSYLGLPDDKLDELLPITESMHLDVSELKSNKSVPVSEANTQLLSRDFVIDRLMIMKCPLSDIREWALLETINL
eukprot:Gregarina_sp_Poly_1__7807@NODE_441_length_8354_cov_301_408350_g77_i1_p5_GENE_NODE_441_length_8354_cov_301_408350_g77_i1NODE_441_length_8354_cov_301_408350_g77_i1_p5_ORF_typecomplete_len202_score32_83CPDase/PF07823_11/3e252_5_RNA_ligase2/PF13563_6/0_562_5_RNA_ligase2/PF13563_6/0_00013_NODE_441_length_8354_cov_301_408350_g77_i175878192